jgi:small-conductance mechanosensitive channel
LQHFRTRLVIVAARPFDVGDPVVIREIESGIENRVHTAEPIS